MKRFVVGDLRADNPPPEGSLVLMENSAPWPIDKILERHTGSPLSHVAILLHFNGEPYVYEAFPPRVRRMTFKEYLEILEKWSNNRWTKRLGGLNQFWWEPRSGLFTSDMLVRMRAKGEGLLGTRYRLILNWWRDRGEKRVHCSEFASLVVEASRLIVSDKNKETPGSLFEKAKLLNSLIDAQIRNRLLEGLKFTRSQ